MAIADVQFVVLDALDPDALSRFWCAVLGTDEDSRVGGDAYVLLKATPSAPPLALQKVPDRKEVKNRMHLELVAADLDGAVEQIVALGGSKLRDAQELDGYVWVNMADPEGNEFDVARA
jgi:predicted enzyme related to lactoylglutathione lyase